MSISGARGGDRLGHLDYIRVVCILYVVAYWHLSGYVKQQGNRYWLGAIMVAALGTFAMISGYLVHRRGWPASTPRFLASRFIRLYPLFAIAVGLFYLWGMIDQPTAIRSLFLVSLIYPPAPVTLWFIVMLLNFDMAYALVAWLRKYRFQWLVYAAIVGGLVLFHLLVHEIPPPSPSVSSLPAGPSAKDISSPSPCRCSRRRSRSTSHGASVTRPGTSPSCFRPAIWSSP
jgi:peptidoglycan/LPS O-acetylase OafA/YrhL